MDDHALVVFMTFIVSITPSLTDMVQVNHDYPGSYRYVLGWYLILLIALSQLWEHIG